jgi:hypothetical protein
MVTPMITLAAVLLVLAAAYLGYRAGRRSTAPRHCERCAGRIEDPWRAARP